LKRARGKQNGFCDSLFLELEPILSETDSEETPGAGGVLEIPSCDGFSGSEGEPASQEEAIRWLEQNIDSIRVGTSNTPYSKEDFIQEAYYAVLQAYAVAKEKKLNFEACFRVTFSRHVKKLREAPIQSSSITTIERGEISEVERNIDSYSVITNREVEEIHIAHEKLIEKALSIMTPPQREVWSLILDKRCSLRDAAKILNKHHAVVSRIYQSGLKHAAEVMGDVHERFLDYTL